MAENYRRALTEEEIPLAFKNVYGDRTKKPISVQATETLVDVASPLPTIVDIEKELDKKDPSYAKIAGLAGLELLGSAAPVVELAARSANKSVLQKIVNYFKKNPDKEYNPESAKVSAKDLGFGEDVYHFTASKKIKDDKFNPNLSIGNWNRMGIHVGAKKAAADRFKQTQGFLANPRGMTIPLKARTNKPLLFDGEILSEFAIIGKLQEMALKRGIGKDGDYATALRKELAKEGYTHIPYINEVENEGAISYIMLTDRPKGSSAVMRSRFADFDPDKIDKPELGLAEGGAVMNEQMQMAFMNEGGLKDDGMNKDPVSGNEVPSGSMAKEVRDDIPAQLSEGEYVVPADVVRYYGVKFFEDLRERAKIGLQEMEMNGRIGGEPVPAGGPINDEELSPQEMQAIQEMMGMAEGGAVNMYRQQQDLYTAPNPAIGNTVEMNRGGQVSGYDEAGDVASQTEQGFLQQGQQAQQSSFRGFPLGATIFPSATTGKTILETPVNPEPAEEVSSVTLYSPDYLTDNQTITLTLPAQSDLYNQKINEGWTTEMPVATTSGGGGGGEDGDDPDPKDPNEWAKGLTAETSIEWVKSNLSGQKTGSGLLNNINLAQNYARSAALANIAEAQGNTALANQIRAEMKTVYDNSQFIRMMPGEWIDGDRIQSKLGDTLDLSGKTTTTPKTTTITPKTAAETAASLGEKASQAGSASELKILQDAQKIAQKAADEGKTIAEVGREIAPSSEAKSPTQKAADEGDPRAGLMNKGGLMTKGKKKKAKK